MGIMDALSVWSIDDVMAAEVIHTGQTDNLIYDANGFRVWHSRMNVEDGMPYNNQITLERFNRARGVWQTLTEYEAK